MQHDNRILSPEMDALILAIVSGGALADPEVEPAAAFTCAESVLTRIHKRLRDEEESDAA